LELNVFECQSHVSFLVSFHVSWAYSQIQEVERLIRGGGNVSVAVEALHNKLRQGGVGHGRNNRFTKVIIIQPKDPCVGAKP